MGYSEVCAVLGCICAERYVFPCMGLIKALVRYILVKRSKTAQIILSLCASPPGGGTHPDFG